MKKIIFILLATSIISLSVSCSKKNSDSKESTETQIQKEITAVDRFISVFLDDNLSKEDKETRLTSISNELAKDPDVLPKIKNSLHECTVQAIDAIVAGNRAAVPVIKRTSNALNNLVAELDSNGVLKSDEIIAFIDEDTKPILMDAAEKLTAELEQACKDGNQYLAASCTTRAEEIGISAFTPAQLERIDKAISALKQ